MITWDKQKLQCKVIDFSIPLDNNVPMKETEKINNYIPVTSELQQMYRNYEYEIIPIVIGTLGAVSTSLKGHLESMSFKQDLTTLVRKLQNAALIGSVKTVKTVLRMKILRQNIRNYTQSYVRSSTVTSTLLVLIKPEKWGT